MSKLQKEVDRLEGRVLNPSPLCAALSSLPSMLLQEDQPVRRHVQRSGDCVLQSVGVVLTLAAVGRFVDSS